MERGTVRTIHELLRKPPPLPCEVLRRVVDFMSAQQRADYEAAPAAAREGHIFRDVHRIDCWLSEFEPCNGWDFPAELRTLGEVHVAPEVLQHVSSEELEQMLDDHRMHKWGTGPDIAAGWGNEDQYQKIRDHNGEIESNPIRRNAQFCIRTSMTTTTSVRVREAGKNEGPTLEERMAEGFSRKGFWKD